MPSVAAAARRFRRTSGQAASTAARRPPVEHRLLLTATLCLLAGGAVMVYSASAPSELTGGSGTGALVRFIGFAAVGLVVLRLASRLRLDLVRRLTGPLLGLAFLALLAVGPGDRPLDHRHAEGRALDRRRAAAVRALRADEARARPL
jgi:hypothetical protein